jgi:hypothetical protein
MAHSRDDTAHFPGTIEERRIFRSLDHVFDLECVDASSGTFRFVGTHAVQEFFASVGRLGDKGYVLGATWFAERVRNKEVPRAARAHMLTRFALALRDMDSPDERRAFRESEVAHAGRFVAAFVHELPVVVLEWAEDAGTGIPTHGFAQQPTAVIRGVLLSPGFDHRKAVDFWRMSAASKCFPDRIFSDPCRSEDGSIFSSWHARAFSLIFTHAPVEAVVRFVAHMREHAVRKASKLHNPATDTWADEFVPATENERLSLFRSIAGGIELPERRDFVTGLYGLS